MSLAKRWAVRIRSRVRSARLRARVLAGAMALAVVAGGVWLAISLAPAGEAWVAVDGVGAGEVPAAAALAERRGVPYRIDGGRLLVRQDDAERFGGALVFEGIVRGPDALDFDALQAEGDIWLTQAERERRWRVAKMRALSRLIGSFPSVRRATVLLEPGRPRGLGRSAVPPSAAVQVTMAAGARMSGRLVRAIADLVAGSTAGMSPSDVRIVDEGGSYRVDPNGAVAEDPIERIRQAEAYYQAKVREVVAYIDGAVVGVAVSPGGQEARCRSVSVSVPRRYLEATYRAGRGGSAPADPNDAELARFARGPFERIRQAVASAVGADDPAVVTVDWYDAPSASAAAAPEGTEATAAGWASARQVVCGALVAAGLASGFAAVRRARRRRPRPSAPQAVGLTDEDGPAAGPAGEDALEALGRMGPDELGELLSGEHPQTAALVLAHVPPETAAEVLARLDGERQVEVSRRIAELSAVDEQVVVEVARGLASRRRGGGVAPGGAGRVARILHHAGYATEKAVLDGLGGREPALAESIRRRMFVFEDVGLLPRELLAAALESLGDDELAIALRTAGRELTEKLLSALPKEAAGRVRGEMERIGPVRLSDVEAAQERVVAAVRRLESGLYVSAEVRDAGEVVA